MTMMTITRRSALALLAATALVPAAHAEDKVLKGRHREDEPGHFCNLRARAAEDLVPLTADD